MSNDAQIAHGRAPGVPCPECGTRIVVEPRILLSGAPTACAGCGLELRVNLEESAPALAALSELIAGIELARGHAAPPEAPRDRRPRRRARRGRGDRGRGRS